MLKEDPPPPDPPGLPGEFTGAGFPAAPPPPPPVDVIVENIEGLPSPPLAVQHVDPAPPPPIVTTKEDPLDNVNFVPPGNEVL